MTLMVEVTVLAQIPSFSLIPKGENEKKYTKKKSDLNVVMGWDRNLRASNRALISSPRENKLKNEKVF